MGLEEVNEGSAQAQSRDFVLQLSCRFTGAIQVILSSSHRRVSPAPGSVAPTLQLAPENFESTEQVLAPQTCDGAASFPSQRCFGWVRVALLGGLSRGVPCCSAPGW